MSIFDIFRHFLLESRIYPKVGEKLWPNCFRCCSSGVDFVAVQIRGTA